MEAEQAKKVEFLRTAEKLKSLLANAEKDNNRHLYNRKSDFKVWYGILEELERSVTVSRKTEKAKILQQLSKIQNNVKSLQQQLKDVKPTPEFVDKLKDTMEEVENAISAFKEEQRQTYQQLLKEERTAINELRVLERKVQLWASGSSTTGRVLKVPSARGSADSTLESHLPEEAVEFERSLLRAGGRQRGWDDYGHQAFLKVWAKHNGRLSGAAEGLEYLCGRTKEDTEQHGKRYQEFLVLHEQKEESIKKRKEEQQREKDGYLKEKEKPENTLKEERRQCEEAQEQKAEGEQKRRQAAAEARKKHKAIVFATGRASQLKLGAGEKAIKRTPAPMPCKFTVGKVHPGEGGSGERAKLEEEKREGAGKE